MDAEKFLKEEIPYSIRQRLIGTISRAYADTENLKTMDASFTSKKGNETLTYIRNLKVEEKIKSEIENGFLPFSYNECKNCAENCTHYEFETNNSIITVSRVSKEGELPRKAKYRENLSFNNQISFFDLNVKVENGSSKKHMLLTHVCKDDKLQSLILGIPSSDGKSWEYKLNLLKELNVILNNDEELPENILKIINKNNQYVNKSKGKSISCI